MTVGLQTESRKAQATMSVLFVLAFILLLFLVVIFGQIREADWSQKRSHDNEAATVAAEGAIEEVIARLRQEANNPVAGTYALLRKTSDNRQKIEIPFTEALLSNTFKGSFKSAAAWVQITDLKELKNQLVEGSADRSGHIRISAETKIGLGEAMVSVTLQMRILDTGIPAPLNAYDLVFSLEDSLIGANIDSEGKTDISRLTNEEAKAISTWKYNIPDGDKIIGCSGIPYVQSRVCRLFPKWQQMRDFLTWNGKDLFFCGDVISPDPNPLELSGMRIHGFGNLFSMRASISLDRVVFADQSFLILGVLHKGEIKMTGMPDFATSRFAVYLPTGRLNLARDSRFKGFAFIRGENMPESSDSFRPDASFRQRRTFVVISGQTMLWKYEA